MNQGLIAQDVFGGGTTCSPPGADVNIPGVDARRAHLAALVILMTACRGGSPTAPGNPPVVPETPSGPGISDIRIAGLPRALSPGSTAQLTVEIVLQTGAVKECAAPTWSIDDASVARVSSSGLLTGARTGYVNVTASCEGLTSRAETRIEALLPFRLSIFPYDKELEPPPAMKLVRATMEFIDGPRAGQRVAWETLEHEPLSDVAWPAKVRFTAESYEPTDFILSEATGERRNSMSTLFDFHVPMTFAPDALTDTFVRTMSDTESLITHPFTMRQPGAVHIRTWWMVDYNDRLSIELWCGGRMLRTATQSYGSAGAGFTHNVSTAGACDVRLRQHKSDASTNYRVAITYPH